jgi:hypothetical protein
VRWHGGLLHGLTHRRGRLASAAQGRVDRTHRAPALRGGALGVAGPTPRAAVLHGECAVRLEDGGNPPDRAGDVEAEEALRLDGVPTTPVASGGPRQLATHPAGQRERER